MNLRDVSQARPRIVGVQRAGQRREIVVAGPQLVIQNARDCNKIVHVITPRRDKRGHGAATYSYRAHSRLRSRLLLGRRLVTSGNSLGRQNLYAPMTKLLLV
ncbi:MAG: hypothetical protein O7G86_00610, partial [Gammaproteobacteria bacterium]|nr:hypothetical protein [Gammaproteobacteria bacterium]